MVGLPLSSGLNACVASREQDFHGASVLCAARVMRKRTVGVCMRIPAILLMMSTPTYAASIAAPGVIAGPDSSAATSNPAAIMYNPAAIAASDGFETIFDVQAAAVRIDIDSWRNGGFDPNTGEPYNTATARVVAPVTFLGGTYEVIDDRLTAGLALTMPFIGGGDYTSSEDSADPPYKSHQRYFGVNTKVITAQLIPAIGFTPLPEWGVHFGAGLTYTLDIFQITKASNVGQEGLGGTEDNPEPYSTDAVLSGETSGSHIGWNAGVFIDRIKYAKVGLSYTSGGLFAGEGEGTVEFPGFVVVDGEAKTLDANLDIESIRQGDLGRQSGPLPMEQVLRGCRWRHHGDADRQARQRGGLWRRRRSDERVQGHQEPAPVVGRHKLRGLWGLSGHRGMVGWRSRPVQPKRGPRLRRQRHQPRL